MVCRGNLPNDLIARLNRRTTSSQRVVGYRPTYRFLPSGYPGAGQLAVVLYQKAISRPLSADTLGTGFKIRAIAQRPEPAIATGSRGSVEDNGFHLGHDHTGQDTTTCAYE